MVGQPVCGPVAMWILRNVPNKATAFFNLCFGKNFIQLNSHFVTAEALTGLPATDAITIIFIH